ncbi:MAG: hypothetical protein JW786_15460 [Desulfobacterales bacterium]|nr:hypothetical protein [Desulfobacterales bacterium]
MYFSSKKRYSIFILISFFTFGCFYPSVNAYVLRGPHLIELMIGSFGKAKSLSVSQELRLYKNNDQEDSIEITETLRYFFPGKYRSEIVSQHSQRIHLISSGIALTVVDGRVVPNSENRFDIYKDIFLYDSRISLQQKLFNSGVDVSVSSLGRFQDKPAYIVGAEYPDESVPQIWLDKNTFRPFRWIILNDTTENHEDFFEVRYQQWREIEGIWYPMVISFYQNSILIREILVENIEVNPSFSADLFDIEYLKSIYPPLIPVAPEQSEKEGLDEVQKTIDNFKKIFE